MDKEKLIADLEQAVNDKNVDQLESLAKQAVENFPEESFGYTYLAKYFTLKTPPLYIKAEIAIAKAMDFGPKDPKVIKLFAEIKEAQHAYEDARLLYLKLLSLDENDVSALTSLGLYELRVSKLFSKALEYLHKAAKLDGDNKKIKMYIADAYYKSKDYENALIYINQALSPEFDEETTLLLINILDAIGDSNQMLKVMDSLVAKRPEVPGYRFEFGKKLYESRVFAESVIQIKKGLELMGDETVDPIFYEPMLKSLFITGKYDESIQFLTDFIEKDPEDYTLYIQRANSYVAKEDLASAQADYAKVIEIVDDPTINLDYRKRKGMLEIRMGNYEAAKATFTAMLDNEFYAPTGNYGLGMVAVFENKPKEAYILLKKAKLKGIKEAEEFIYKKMGNYLKEVRDELVAANQPELEKNAASPLISKIAGQLWWFDSMESVAMESQPDFVKQMVDKSLQSFSALITEKGGLFVKSIQADSFVYKILSESGDTLKLEITNLDGTKVYNATLTLKGDQLHFSEKEGEVVKFKKLEMNKIPLSVIKAYVRTIIPPEMEYLGDKAKPVIEKFYQPAG